MRNPFKRSGSHNPYQYSGPGPSSNKLIIVAGVITFVIIIVVMFESVVVVQAGHRGVSSLSHRVTHSNARIYSM
jgi:hypothetical protein